MISPLAKLACRRDELNEEIDKLCTRLGQLTQERFVITTAIKELAEDALIYQGNETSDSQFKIYGWKESNLRRL